MSSVKLNKQLILLNFRRKIFRFVNIKVVAYGYNDLRVVTRKGKLGNRGRESTTSFSGPDSFKNAMRHAHNLERDFNRKNYVSQSRIEEALESMYSQLDRSRKTKVAGSKGENCAFCNTYINQMNAEKIKKWADGEGNWNYSKDSPLYKKVICIDCQIEKEIFQTRIDEDFELKE